MGALESIHCFSSGHGWAIPVYVQTPFYPYPQLPGNIPIHGEGMHCLSHSHPSSLHPFPPALPGASKLHGAGNEIPSGAAESIPAGWEGNDANLGMWQMALGKEPAPRKELEGLGSALTHSGCRERNGAESGVGIKKVRSG